MAPDAVVRSVDELADGHASFRAITLSRLQPRILIATSRGSSLDNNESTCVSSPGLSSPLMPRALMQENSVRAAAASRRGGARRSPDVPRCRYGMEPRSGRRRDRSAAGSGRDSSCRTARDGARATGRGVPASPASAPSNDTPHETPLDTRLIAPPWLGALVGRMPKKTRVWKLAACNFRMAERGGILPRFSTKPLIRLYLRQKSSPDCDSEV